jgi:hypothetical protein
MQVLRRIGQWMAWGSLGPLVFLVGAVSLYQSLRILQSDSDEYQEPLMVTAELLGGLTAIVGAHLVLRPKTRYWWALGFAMATCAANVSWDLRVHSLTGSGLGDAAFWLIEAGLLAFYAYHCHVPDYRWGAPLSSGAPNRVPSESAVQEISQ